MVHFPLHYLLKAAVDDGVLVSNPAEKLGRLLRLVASKATRQEDIKAMTRNQRRVFLETAATEAPRYYPLSLPWPGPGSDWARQSHWNGSTSMCSSESFGSWAPARPG